MKVTKLFQKVHLGASFSTLAAIAGTSPRKGECYVFVNAGMTGCKIWYGGGTLVYRRALSGRLDVNELINAAAAAGGKRLSFDGTAIDRLTKAAAALGERAGWLAKVVG
jgi:hypothetical protein